MQVRALGHVVLKVRSLERSVPFYGGVLGLRAVARWGERMVFFSIAGNHHDIALIEVGEGTEKAPDTAPGLAHLALKIGDDLDTLREAEAHLASHGVGPLHQADHKVSQSIYFDDPDGNQIELFVDADPAIWRDDPRLVATSEMLAL